MNADCKGALAQINQSYKSFTHNGNRMSKQAVKEVLEYAVSKGYDHTGQLRDSEIDVILTKGTTIEQWDRYYADLKSHEEHCAKTKPIEPDHMEYKEQKFKGEWTFKPGALERYSNDWDAYQKKLSEWEMMRSCDAPNKPGYYRANND